MFVHLSVYLTDRPTRESFTFLETSTLPVNTYSDTGHRFYNVHLQRPITLCYNDLDQSRLGFVHQTFRFQGEHSNAMSNRRGKRKNAFLLYDNMNYMATP